MTSEKRPRAPAGLEATGKALWRRLSAAYDRDGGEAAQLEPDRGTAVLPERVSVPAAAVDGDLVTAGGARLARKSSG
jgi:hypothetical protein